MSRSKRRSKSRRQGRERCPNCGAKDVKILNRDKDQFILECKRPSCNKKWHIPSTNSSMRLRLSDKNIRYEKIKQELPKEDKELITEVIVDPLTGQREVSIVTPDASSLLEIGPDGSYRLKK